MILVLDPGGTTGVAAFDGKTTPIGITQVERGLDGFIEWYKPLQSVPKIVLYEKFTPRENIKGKNYIPMYIEGAIAALTPKDDVLLFQHPHVKSTVGDQGVKDLGWWVPGKRHAMDAVIHFIAYAKPELVDFILGGQKHPQPVVYYTPEELQELLLQGQ